MFDKEKGIIKLSRSQTKDIDYLKELDDEQIQPVLQTEGPVLVMAGAGSGKTRVLTYRVAHMINQGIKPQEILLLTFTNKSAQDMMRKVTLVLGNEPKGLTGGTYHHVGNLMVRKYAKLLGLQYNYTIIDSDDAVTLMKNAKVESNIDMTQFRIPKESVLLEILSLSINKQQSIESIIKSQFNHFFNIKEQIYAILGEYTRLKMKNNVIDFDDILVFWHRLLKDNENIRTLYTNKIYKYILIDEFQDTNTLQFDIIHMLAGEKSNIMVVGDPNQSIYRWRGAEIDNILNFPNIFKNTKVYNVSYNYRSTPEILNFANNSIKNNKKRSGVFLKAKNQNGEKPFIINSPSSELEAAFVAEKILQLHNDEGVDFKNIGILYRSHFMVKDVEMELTSRGIPYDIRSGKRFFEQKHIKDVISILRIIHNPKDEMSWSRMVQKLDNIGAKTSKQIIDVLINNENPLEYLKNEKDFKYVKRGRPSWLYFVNIINNLSNKISVAEIVSYFLKEFYENYIKLNFDNHKERIRDIEGLVEFSGKYKTVSEFLEEVTLMDQLVTGQSADADEVKEKDKDKVSLTTIHKAKGLEWKYVFLIGCSDGRFPTSSSLGEPDELEEERRLFYVGATRAEKELYISFPSRYLNFEIGSYISVSPSMFIEEIDSDLYYYMRIQE